MTLGEEKSIMTAPISGNQENLGGSPLKYAVENSDKYFAAILVDNGDYSKTYLFTFTWPIEDGYRIFAFYPADLSTRPQGAYVSTDSMARSTASLWNCNASVRLVNISFEPAEEKIGQVILLISSDRPEVSTTVKIETSPYSEEQITGALEYPTCSSNHKGYIGSSFTIAASDVKINAESLLRRESDATQIDWEQGEFENIGEPKAALIWQEAEEDNERILHNTGSEYDSREKNDLPNYSGAGYWYLSRKGDTLIYDQIYVPEDAEYDFWIRDYSDADTSEQRAINLYIDGEFIGKFNANIFADGFEWNYLTTEYLANGFHEVKIEKAEDTSYAAVIDAFLLTRDDEYIPEGRFVYHGPFVLDDGSMDTQIATDHNENNSSESAVQDSDSYTGQTFVQSVSSTIDTRGSECLDVDIDTKYLTDLKIKFMFDTEDLSKVVDLYFVFNYDGVWLSFDESGRVVNGITPFITSFEVPAELTLLDVQEINFTSFKGHTLTVYAGYVLYDSFPMSIKYGCMRYMFK